MDGPVSGAEVTRKALLDAAIKLFGERGFDAVSTREIADLAASNIGSIAYHFGGKAGLRRACAEHVIGQLQAIVGPAFSQPLPPLDPAMALKRIEQMLTLFCHQWLLNADSQTFVRFVIREQFEGTEIVDIFYSNWMRPMHSRFCELLAIATGQLPDDEEVKIAVFTFVGQVVYFRVASPLVLRRLSWDELTPERARKIIDSVLFNMRAIVAALRVQS